MNDPWYLDHQNVIKLTSYMADHYYDASDVAYAVEKPWKFGDVFLEAIQEELGNEQEDDEIE